MADTSGMNRNVAEFGEFGKTGKYVETADEYSDFLFKTGKTAPPEKTASLLKQAAQTEPAIDKAVSGVSIKPAAGPSLGDQIAKSVLGNAASTAVQLSKPGAQVSGLGTAWGMAKGVFSAKAATQRAEMKQQGEQLRTQNWAAKEDVKHNHKLGEIAARGQVAGGLTEYKTEAQKGMLQEKLGTQKEITANKTEAQKDMLKKKLSVTKYATDTRAGALRPAQTDKFLAHREAVFDQSKKHMGTMSTERAPPAKPGSILQSPVSPFSGNASPMAAPAPKVNYGKTTSNVAFKQQPSVGKVNTTVGAQSKAPKAPKTGKFK